MNQTFSSAIELFARSSTTYFYSHYFFPKRIRDEITILYAFIRTADNFVDAVPQDTAGFRQFKDETQRALGGETSNHPVIRPFADLVQRHGMDPQWAMAFLDAMEQDISVVKYATHQDLNRYMHGSAEVVGLMICKILQLPEDALEAAQLQSRAMQFINFIRDVGEDLRLGRVYIPEEDLKRFNITKMPPVAPNEIESFSRLIQYEIGLYRKMQQDALVGYRFIPWVYRIAVRTAAEMYSWTADTIEKDPMILFRKKVKPSRFRIIIQGLWNGVKSTPLLLKSLYEYSFLYRKKSSSFKKAHQ